MDRLGHGDLVKDLQHLVPIETMLKRLQLDVQHVDQLPLAEPLRRLLILPEQECVGVRMIPDSVALRDGKE